jgi:hypothetical protein
MIHRQSACRLLIATLALAIASPAIAQDETAASETDAPVDEVLDEVEPTRRKRRDPSDWSDWRNYTPSIGAGFGVTFDWMQSSIDGTLKYSQSGIFDPCNFNAEATGNCTLIQDEFDDTISGGAFTIDVRLDLPEFDIPSKPRLFAMVNYVAHNQERKSLANFGVQRAIWLESANVLGGGVWPPFLRVEQGFDLENTLYLGVGGSFLLPVDAYPIRITAGVSYYRSKGQVDALIDWATSPVSATRPPPQASSIQRISEELITQGIAPSLGLDVEVGRVGWLALTFYSNSYLGIPLAGTDWGATMFSGYAGFLPDEGFTDFSYERGINVSTFVGIRFSFVGD